MSKDIPIIFSAPMIRVLLDGRKTMTRRILKSVPPAPAMDAIHPNNVARHAVPYLDAYCSEHHTDANPRGMSRNWCWWTRDDRQCLPTVNVRYAPGDRLWVRESAAFIWPDEVQPERKQDRIPEYRADTDGKCLPGDWPDEEKGDPDCPKWCSSIHMPRWASRLTLIVTGVKVERVQDISGADAMAEGVETWRAGWSQKESALAFLRGSEAAHETKDGTVAQRLFFLLWTSLHGDKSWAENPEVVAVTFRAIKANIDAPEARLAA